MAGIDPEKLVISNLKKSLEIGGVIIKIYGGSDHGCSLYGGGNVESSSDLDCGTMVPIARWGYL